MPATRPDTAVQPLAYPAMRLQWCRHALLAFLRRWAAYLLVGALLVGAGSNSVLGSISAVAAWLVLPVMQSAGDLPRCLAWVLAESTAGAALVWAMRRLLWPEHWRMTERGLPLAAGQLWRSDAQVVAIGLLPWLLLLAVGAGSWVLHRPAWLAPVMGRALLACAGLAVISWALGVAVLQGWRRAGVPGARRLSAVASPPVGPQAWPRRWLWVPRAIWWLPLWRGPAQRTGLTLAVGLAALLAWVAGVPAWPLPWLGWPLAGLSLGLLVLTSALHALSRAEFAPLLAATQVLPLAPSALGRQRVALVMAPAWMCSGALALVWPWAQLRPMVALAYLVSLLVTTWAEVGEWGGAPAKASRWLVGLVLMVALGSEVVR